MRETERELNEDSRALSEKVVTKSVLARVRKASTILMVIMEERRKPKKVFSRKMQSRKPKGRPKR